jgi:hypothetical protein
MIKKKKRENLPAGQLGDSLLPARGLLLHL